MSSDPTTGTASCTWRSARARSPIRLACGSEARRGLPRSRTCFCEFCRARAEKQGISVRRAVAGFEKLEALVAQGRTRRRPADGYYISLWRLMLRYPELLMWEHLWHEGYRDLLQLLHDKVKEIRPGILFGSHIFPNHSMNPVFRAEQDLSALAPYHDFIKVPIYYTLRWRSHGKLHRERRRDDLATGHSTLAEVLMIMRKARRRVITRIFVTHPMLSPVEMRLLR